MAGNPDPIPVSRKTVDFVREIYYYKDYYLKFFGGLRPDIQKKFNWTLQLIASIQMVPEKYLKHITGSQGIYEIRVDAGGDTFRIFCFFDVCNLIIVVNGFQKKSQKTPRKEIKLAEKLKREYFYAKEKK